jgi:predicted RNase H-like HicB family nuclease
MVGARRAAADARAVGQHKKGGRRRARQDEVLAVDYSANPKEASVKFRILIEPDEDGVFVATVPSLPGCVSQGATRAEALRNIREAIEGYVESLQERGEPIPPSITEEVVDVAV